MGMEPPGVVVTRSVSSVMTAVALPRLPGAAVQVAVSVRMAMVFLS